MSKTTTHACAPSCLPPKKKQPPSYSGMQEGSCREVYPWFRLLDQHMGWFHSHTKNVSLLSDAKVTTSVTTCPRNSLVDRGAVSPPLNSNALKGVAIVCSVSKTSEHKCELIRSHIEWRWHFIYPVRCLVDLPEYLDVTHFKGLEHHTGTWELQVRGYAFYSSSGLSTLSVGLLPRYC